MVLSMTGYGKSSTSFNGKTISVEIKSLNSKSADLYLKMPSLYKEQELAVRQLVTDALERGKIDVSVSIESSGTSKPVEINKDLAKSYFQELKKLEEITGESEADYLSLILRMPDIYMASTEETSPEEWECLFELTKEACAKVNDFRKQEGEALEQEFSLRINDIRKLLNEVEPYEALRIETIRERMRKALEDLSNGPMDQNRFEQELIFYIEKLDISEEKMRLANHLDYFMDTMKTENPGKKLGFITQELGREINTLGSKSYHVEMQKLVVEMKDNLEKIKEQVLNTL